MLGKIIAMYRDTYSGLPRNAWLLSLVQFVNRSNEQNRGRHMGWFGVSFSLAWMIGPIGGSGIYAHFSPAALWFGCGGFGLLLAYGFMRLTKKQDGIA